MNSVIEEIVVEFNKLSEISKLIAISNIQTIITTEKAVKQHYNLADEPPKQTA
jgi:hypothetical protein